MQPLAFLEELDFLLIATLFFQVIQQCFLTVVRPRCVAEVVQEEQFRARVGLKKAYIAMDSLLRLVDGFGVFLLLADIQGAFGSLVFCVHVDDAEDMGVVLIYSFLYFFLQFFHACVLGIAWLKVHSFEYITQ